MNDESDAPALPFDRIARDLLALRSDAGDPSYAEIARRVASGREARGVPTFEARVGRTTVYDAFRAGRRRLDVDLVLEIVRALGGDQAEVDAWRGACRDARARADGRVGVADTVAPVADGAATGPEHPRHTLRIFLVCLLVNLIGAELVFVLKIPLFLDMGGTALAAIVLGPWWGAAVGLTTNVGMAATQGWMAIPFALVNIAGALMWGHGVRRFRLGNGLPRFFLLNLLVGLGCTVVASPIVYFLFGGGVGHGSESVTHQILHLSHHLWVAVTSANLLTSLTDKLLMGFLALVVIETFPIALAAGRDHVRLVVSRDED